MDEFSKMFQTLQNSRNSDNNWIYVNPVTGKTHEGIGQGPLPWGQYPENMDEDSEAAQNYDMYRADIRPLPSELFKPGGLEEIQNLEEGSQLEDPMWMKASRTLHKYLEAPGRKETGPMRLAPPSKREMDFDEYAAWGVKFINAFENNTVAMAVNTARLMDAPPEVSQAMYYLLETGDRSGILGSNIGRAALNMATDPFMWVGLGTLGIGTAGKFAGQKMSKMAFKEILRKNMLSKTTAVVGTEGALYGAAYDLARQNVGVSADAQDGFNLGQTALSTAIGGGAGTLLAGVGPGAVEAARRGLVSLGEGASSRMADGGSQLNTGIDIDPLLAKVGELVSDESDEIKPEVDYEGFTSQALEVTKALNQKKGTGQQFKSQLLKNGVKQDEIDWLGLDEILNKDKVTKDEIEQHIRDNRVELDTFELSGDPDSVTIDFDEPTILTPDEVYGPNHGAEEMFEQYLLEPGRLSDIETAIKETGFNQETKNKTIEKFKTVYSDDGIVDKNFRNEFESDEIAVLEEAGNRLHSDIYYNNKDYQVIQKVDRKDGYTITGNDEFGYNIFVSKEESKNYRNTLLYKPVYSLHEAQIALEEIKRDEGLLNYDSETTRFHDYTQPGGENYRELLLTYPDSKQTYKGGHFEDFDDVLAHMRVSDRTVSADGEKVLYAEEIQSDWAQQGRSRGFKPSKEELKSLSEKTDNLRQEYINKMNEYDFVDLQGNRTPFSDWFDLAKKESNVSFRENDNITDINFLGRTFNNEGRLGFVRYKNSDINPFENNKSYDNKFIILGEEINQLQAKMTRSLDKAPFVTDTDKWTQLTLKKLLAKAVEEGNYDYVAISPGDVQFARWRDEGVKNYYDKIVPKNAQKVVKKLDKGALVTVDLDIEFGKQPTLAIKLTNQLKEKVKNGQALFSVPSAVAAGAFASQGENDGN